MTPSSKRMTVGVALQRARFAVAVEISAAGRWQVLGPAHDRFPQGAKFYVVCEHNAEARKVAARWKAQIALVLMGWPSVEANDATAEAQAAGISGDRNIFHHARRNRAD